MHAHAFYIYGTLCVWYQLIPDDGDSNLVLFLYFQLKGGGRGGGGNIYS